MNPSGIARTYIQKKVMLVYIQYYDGNWKTEIWKIEK